MKTAILIDGAFLIKRIRKIEPQNHFNAERIADLAFHYALLHLQPTGKNEQPSELYRIFFYDCISFEKKMHNPVSKRSIDFAKTDEAIFRHELHQELKSKRKLALCLGKLSEHTTWTIKPTKMKDLLKNPAIPPNADDIVLNIQADDMVLDIKQKGVDMRIGLDIASLAYKQQVQRIVLFSGDSDFVPAAKLARREGIDFILDPMWNHIPPDLHEHIDGLRSVCPDPRKSN